MDLFPGGGGGPSKGVTGVAPINPETGRGTAAKVYQERIAALVTRTDPIAWHGYRSLPRRMADALVLGHMMAHELEHLLLSVGGHNDQGLMKYPWGANELHLLASRQLKFTDAESSLIRSDRREDLGD